MKDNIESLLAENDQSSLLQTYKSGELDEKNAVIRFLLEREYSKTLWLQAATFLRSLPDKQLEGYVFDLFSWLQDINWPGSLDIVRILTGFPVEILIRPINEEIKRATSDGDELWLGGIKIVCIEKEELIPLLDKSNKKILDKVEWVDWESEFLK